MKCYPAVKKKGLTFCDDADGLEGALLSETRQTERQEPCDLTHAWNLMSKMNKQYRHTQTPRTERRASGEGLGGLGGKGEGIKRHKPVAEQPQRQSIAAQGEEPTVS